MKILNGRITKDGASHLWSKVGVSHISKLIGKARGYMNNPLVSEEILPLFSQIKPEHIEPAIQGLLESSTVRVNALLAQSKTLNWENLIFPLEVLKNKVNETWGIVSHLNSVCDAPEWRAAYDKMLPKISLFLNELEQNQELHQVFLNIKNSSEYSRLDLSQKRCIDNALRDFRLSGVSLTKDKREELKAQKIHLEELQNIFKQNVLDAKNDWKIHISDPAELSGIPMHALHTMEVNAHAQGKSGWILTLDFPCYNAVMSYAENRMLRKTLYTAYTTLASDQSETQRWDNGPIIQEILETRQKIANLLEFSEYAEYSLSRKMIKDPNEVMQFLTDVVTRVKKRGWSEYEELKKFAKEKYNLQSVEAWDVRYLSERLLETEHHFSEEELRDYFPESIVMSGLFTILNKLYGITVKEVKNVDRWHKSVKLFEIYDENGILKGMFYTDLYVRAHKRNGAWCDACRNRLQKTNSLLQIPVAYVVCNFSSPTENEEAYFTHDEVQTLFHEMGHCLHLILTEVDYPSLSPFNGLEWDAVELPSQLMENWCWHWEALQLISQRKNTNEKIPKDLYLKIKASKNFQVGFHLLRQLEFAWFDLEIHRRHKDAHPVSQQILNKVRSEVCVVPVPSFNRFQNSFLHIFAGGYAAGYYSYLWSEVLSANVFEVFEKQGIFNRDTGKKFLSVILAKGGTKDAMALCIEFLGEKPKIQALLKQYGI